MNDCKFPFLFFTFQKQFIIFCTFIFFQSFEMNLASRKEIFIHH
jgi:hypothetical protein